MLRRPLPPPPPLAPLPLHSPLALLCSPPAALAVAAAVVMSEAFKMKILLSPTSPPASLSTFPPKRPLRSPSPLRRSSKLPPSPPSRCSSKLPPSPPSRCSSKLPPSPPSRCLSKLPPSPLSRPPPSFSSSSLPPRFPPTSPPRCQLRSPSPSRCPSRPPPSSPPRRLSSSPSRSPLTFLLRPPSPSDSPPTTGLLPPDVGQRRLSAWPKSGQRQTECPILTGRSSPWRPRSTRLPMTLKMRMSVWCVLPTHFARNIGSTTTRLCKYKNIKKILNLGIYLPINFPKVELAKSLKSRSSKSLRAFDRSIVTFSINSFKKAFCRNFTALLILNSFMPFFK